MSLCRGWLSGGRDAWGRRPVWAVAGWRGFGAAGKAWQSSKVPYRDGSASLSPWHGKLEGTVALGSPGWKRPVCRVYQLRRLRPDIAGCASLMHCLTCGRGCASALDSGYIAVRGVFWDTTDSLQPVIARPRRVSSPSSSLQSWMGDGSWSRAFRGGAGPER